MRKQIDARVIKSKAKLKESLLNLMKEKKFEKINVCEICDNADIHRMTFYNHYTDKYALFSETIADIKEEIHHRYNRELILCAKLNPSEQVIKLFEVLINELNAYKPIFNSIIGSENHHELFALIHKTFEEGLTDLSYHIFNDKSTYLDLKVKFFVGGVGHLITYYMYDKDNINSSEFKTCLRKIIDTFYNQN